MSRTPISRHQAMATLACLPLFLFLGHGRRLRAANVFFDNPTAGANWNNAANWHTGSLPGGSDNAIIATTNSNGVVVADVDIESNVPAVSQVTLANNGSTTGTLNLEIGGTLDVGTLVVGRADAGTFNHNGGTLIVNTVDIGQASGTGTLNLNGNNLSLTNFNYGGPSSTAIFNRGGANITVSSQLEVEGSANTWVIDTGDDLQTRIRVDDDGTVDLNGVAAFAIPTLQIGGGSPGNLARTGGGTFDVTSLDVAGGSSVTTVSGDAANNVTVRQAATLTLGADLNVSSTASIRENATLNLDGNELAATNIDLGLSTINRGAGGTLNASNELEVEDAGNTYLANTSDTIGNRLRVDGNGTFDLNGIANFSVPTLQIGGGTPGNLARSGGGTFDVTSLDIAGGSTVSTASGDAVSGSLTVRQGATLNLGDDLAPSSVNVRESAMLNLPAGVSLTAASIDLGNNNSNPSATLRLGTAAGSATITGTGGENLTVSESGQLRGWGTVDMTGQVFNAGRIVADGFGTGATPLDLSAFSTINAGNTGRDNLVGEDHGWFAVNEGRLIMPEVGVGVGSGVNVRVGESADTVDTNGIDMINSVELVFGNVGQAGTVSVEVLDPESSELFALFDGAVSAFEINVSGVQFDEFDLTIRYDDIFAGIEGINENNLKLFSSSTGLIDIATLLDTSNKRITAENISTFSQFVVALDADIPEPSTVSLLGLGLLGLAAARRRRRHPAV